MLPVPAATLSAGHGLVAQAAAEMIDEMEHNPFPDAAKANGMAGRDECVLIQDATFVRAG